MTPLGWLVVYCVVIASVSFGGGSLPSVMRLTHQRMELILSFVAGAMLGVAVLHMLPHAVMMQDAAGGEAGGLASHAHERLTPVWLWLLGGFLLMFLVERFFAFHHHEAAEIDGAESAPAGGDAHDHHDRSDGDHEAHHRHVPHEASARLAGPDDARLHSAGLTWTGAAVGLTIHSLVEGIALAASVAGESHGDGVAIAGLGTFLVIVLHKPFDAITLATLMLAGGRSHGLRLTVNIVFSLIVPLGAVAFAWGAIRPDAPLGSAVVAAALAFSAGTFLCIALSDLLPELRFHHHDRLKLSAALLAGLAVAWGTALIEGRAHTNRHDHDSGSPANQHASEPPDRDHAAHELEDEHEH